MVDVYNQLQSEPLNESCRTELRNVINGLQQIVNGIASYQLQPLTYMNALPSSPSSATSNSGMIISSFNDPRDVACAFITTLAKDISLTPLLAYITIRSLLQLMEKYRSSNSNSSGGSMSNKGESKRTSMHGHGHGGTDRASMILSDDIFGSTSSSLSPSLYYDAIDNSLILCRTIEGILMEIHRRVESGEYNTHCSVHYGTRTRGSNQQLICDTAGIDGESWRTIWQQVFDIIPAIGHTAPVSDGTPCMAWHRIACHHPYT